MSTVFIGGSRAVSRLNPVVREKLNDVIEKRCTILIGDANGADKAVQKHLAERRYLNVTVFCMDHCRNNVGNWQTRGVMAPPQRGATRGFSYYAAKDLVMAEEANCGIMLWDGKSKGTLNNVLNLLHSGKPVLLYLAPEKTFRRISTGDQLQHVLASYSGPDLDRAFRRLELESASQKQIQFGSSK